MKLIKVIFIIACIPLAALLALPLAVGIHLRLNQFKTPVFGSD